VFCVRIPVPVAALDDAIVQGTVISEFRELVDKSEFWNEFKDTVVNVSISEREDVAEFGDTLVSEELLGLGLKKATSPDVCVRFSSSTVEDISVFLIDAAIDHAMDEVPKDAANSSRMLSVLLKGDTRPLSSARAVEETT